MKSLVAAALSLAVGSGAFFAGRVTAPASAPVPEPVPTAPRNLPQLREIAERLGLRVAPDRADEDLVLDIRLALGDSVRLPRADLSEDAVRRAGKMLSADERETLKPMLDLLHRAHGGRVLVLPGREP